MAQGKKSFIAYSDWKEVFDELPNEDAGVLIKHIFAYVNDENPTSDSLLIRAVFANIKTTLKRDLQRWDNQIKQRSEAGKRSAEKRGLTKTNERLTVVEKDKRKSTVNDNDNDNVNVSDSVIVNDNVKEDIKVSAKKAEMDFIDQIIQLFVEAHGDYLIINNGEERKAAAKILGIYKKKYPGATSEETLAALKQYFLNCVNINDAWLKTNMSLPIMVNKFNQINKILKNGTNKPGGATNKELTELLAHKLGVKE